MGCKAEGAAQGFTVLGGLVLLVSAFERIYMAMIGPSPGSLEGLIQIFLGIAIIVLVSLAFDACGFISWKVQKSGALLSLFGFIIILIVSLSLETASEYGRKWDRSELATTRVLWSTKGSMADATRSMLHGPMTIGISSKPFK